MLKKILFGVALLATFTACTDDYTDWSSPQANAQTDAVTFGDGSVSSVSLIDFAYITDDQKTVQVCNMQAPTASDASYSPSYKIHLGSSTYDLDESGNMSVADLKDYVETNYGKAPTRRDIEATVEMWLSNGTTTVKTATSETFTVSTLLVAPYISEHYYLIGAPSAWSPTETSMPFSHSDTNVYDDPVFTVTFPVADGQTWFAIADDKTVASGEWSDVLGCKEGNGNNGMSGNIARRTDLNDDGSWVINVDGDAKFVKMTINMMDYTYTLEKLNFGAYIYEIGNESSWSTGHALAGLNYDGQYTGFAYLNGEFKYKPNADNWDGDYEMASGDAYEGTLTESGSANISAIVEGFYMMSVDLVNMTYKHTLISTIGVIGDATAGGWNSDVDMTFDSSDGSWNISNLTLTDGTIKFRANDAWDINWGGDVNGLVANGENISVTAGTYDIKLFPICDGLSTCTLTKK